MTSLRGALLAVGLATGLLAQAAEHHDHGGRHGPALGEVEFATTCMPRAHALFNEGMLYQHSFWYRASRHAFERALDADPGCVIAYWGIAQSLLLNPFGPPPPQNLAEGLTLLEKAAQIGGGSEREKHYIAALTTLFAEHKTIDHRTRIGRYVKAMEALANAYREDDEAQIHYALALNVAAPPSDKTHAMPLRAAAILEPILRRKPRHPGVAHYLVHSYDYPSIAHKGIEAAKRYAETAGASPHALHMPSHIFTRVGLWRESIEANVQSADVARKDNEPDDELHAMDYLVYAYLQLARDEEARKTILRMQAVKGINAARHTGPFALAASAARYAIERGDWQAAASIPVQATRFAHVDAITHFARAVGAARTGALDAARSDAEQLGLLRDRLHKARDAYWAGQVAIQYDVARAWILYAEGDRAAALAALRAAADAEDETDKHVVTPGPLAPAREMYGQMLLLGTRAAEALTAFEATLRKEPERLNALLGAGLAAEQLRDEPQARRYYKRVIAMTASSSERAEVARAAAFLSARR